jgi:hypothetical protein
MSDVSGVRHQNQDPEFGRVYLTGGPRRRITSSSVPISASTRFNR